MDSGPPTWEEMKKAPAMGKPGKAVNRAEIPSEVWRKSESSLNVLWKLMRGDVGTNERRVRGCSNAG